MVRAGGRAEFAPYQWRVRALRPGARNTSLGVTQQRPHWHVEEVAARQGIGPARARGVSARAFRVARGYRPL